MWITFKKEGKFYPFPEFIYPETDKITKKIIF